MHYRNIIKTALSNACLISLFLGFNVQASQQFASGSIASSPHVGVSFKIPEGFNGNYNQDVGGVIIQGSQITLVVSGVSRGEVNTAGDVVVDLLRELGIQLQPTNVTQPSTNRLDATFSAWYEGQAKAMMGTVRKGPYDNVVAVVGMGQSGQEANVEATIKKITDTLQWSQPQGNNQRQKLAGMSLYRSGGSSDGRGGFGGFSASTSTKEQIDFCSSGQYSYQSTSESFISTGTASMPSSSRNQHQGNWWLVADLGGNYYVYLESSVGEYYIWPIYETNNGANVNGNNFTASKSQQCV